MTWIDVILISLVEGLTEFLPISSTAHMIFTSSLLGIEKDPYVKMFEVSIQFGAILAVVALYWRKFFDFSRISFYLKLACAVIPALVLGYLFDDLIEGWLGSPLVIAIVLVAGGVVLLFIDRVFRRPVIDREEQITIPRAVAIGFWQCLAIMPGTSRAAASIIGGMQQKLTRSLAAEFSFFLAVPTMLAVTVYSLFLKHWENGLKGYEMITESSKNTMMFLAGNVIAFLVALMAIKVFIGFLKRYGFRVWGIYRILIGLVMIGLYMRGVI